MRIADHAPAMQGSQALQQPAATTHQQQILSGEMATAALNRQTDKRSREVTDSEKTEHRTIRGDDQKQSGGKPERGMGKGGKRNVGETGAETRKGPSEPGNGNLLDVIV